MERKEVPLNLQPRVVELKLAPSWTPAADLTDAESILGGLGTNRLENYYLIGKHLKWVKDKVEYGEFSSWVKSHTPYSIRTAERYMEYATDCDIAGGLLVEYKKNKRVIMTGFRDDLFDGNRVLTIAKFRARVRKDVKSVALKDYLEAAQVLHDIRDEMITKVNQERVDMTGTTFAEQAEEINATETMTSDQPNA